MISLRLPGALRFSAVQDWFAPVLRVSLSRLAAGTPRPDTPSVLWIACKDRRAAFVARACPLGFSPEGQEPWLAGSKQKASLDDGRKRVTESVD